MVFRYLKGTVNLALKHEKKGDAVLVGYSDGQAFHFAQQMLIVLG